jgi:hypothetical protein
MRESGPLRPPSADVRSGRGTGVSVDAGLIGRPLPLDAQVQSDGRHVLTFVDGRWYAWGDRALALRSEGQELHRLYRCGKERRGPGGHAPDPRRRGPIARAR